MMSKTIALLASAAIIAGISTTATAGALEFAPAPAPAAERQIGGEFSAWGMDVIPSNYYDDGDTCDNNGGGSNCGTVFGWGASASVYVPLGPTKSLTADMLYEFHFETDSRTNDRDDHANYGSVGFHLTMENNPDMPWGGFVFLASGHNNEDSDSAGPVAGAGAEIMVSGFVVQAGGMFLLDADNADDTLENLFFVGASREFSIGNGNLNAGAFYGFGDFDENTSFDDPGTWAQVNLFYEAPLGLSNLNWFVGYQGDYVSVDDGDVEEAMFHSVKVGINIPFGGPTGPFSTPNFRAPLVNAGQFN